jgi:hypothetical protein
MAACPPTSGWSSSATRCSGEGRSKKAAEQQAAEAAWLVISGEAPARGRPRARGYQQESPGLYGSDEAADA